MLKSEKFGFLLKNVFTFVNAIVQQLKTTEMKSEQFKHNLAKHKRQAKAQREEDSRLKDLFADFGKIYSQTYKTK